MLLTIGCKAQKEFNKKMVVSVAQSGIMPEQLMEKEGKVNFTYTLTLPPKTILPVETIKLTPILIYAGKKQELSSFFLQGQGVKHTNFPTVPYRKSFQTTLPYEFLWQPGMENAQVMMKMESSRCGKINGVMESIIYSKGIKRQQIPTVPSKKDHRDITGEIRGIIMFPMSKNMILSGQDYMTYLRRNLDTVMAYPGAEITSIELVVSCSPDGSKRFNTLLGEERFQTSRRYFQEQLGLNRYAAWNNPRLSTHQIIIQNWQGLYNLLEDSQIPVRTELINKLKAVPDNQRERLFVEQLSIYPIIKNQYLHLLRNAQIIIRYKMPWHETKPTIVPGMW